MSYRSKRRDPPEFFVDRSLGKNTVADRLRAAGETVHIHDEHFKPDERDEVWLLDVGRRGWLILTKDKAIRRRLLERDALIAAGAMAFFLTSGNLTGADMAAGFERALPAMKRLYKKQPAPFIATITASGGVTLLAIDKP